MTITTDSRSIPDLIRDLTNDVTNLFRKEVALAKAEAAEKAGKALVGIEMMLIGAVLGLAALGVLLTAAVAGVAALLVTMGMSNEAATGVAALIVGGIVGIIAIVLFKRGLNSLKAHNLMLDRTAHSLSRDADVIKEKTHG
jgi:hypothetical protein